MMRTQAGFLMGCALVALTVAAEATSAQQGRGGQQAQGRGGQQAPPQLVTQPDREGFIVVTPEAIREAQMSGGRTQYLYGNPNQPGLYVIQLVWEPGQGSRPHYHNEARLINVLEGTWYVHTGAASDVYNPDAMTPVHAGTFIYEPANGHHYDMAKDQRVVVQIMGVGPVNTTQIPQPDAGSAPPR